MPDIDPMLLVWLASGLVLALLASFGLSVRHFNGEERGVVFRLGRFHGVVGPGRVMALPFLDKVERVDLAPFTLALTLPVLKSQDGQWHTTALSATCRVLQPERAVTEARDYREATELTLEGIVREVASTMTSEALLDERGKLGRVLKKAVNEQTLTWGVDVQSVEVTRLSAIETPAPDEPVGWVVQLDAIGPNKIAVIKRVREITGEGLKETKDRVESAPVMVREGLQEREAEALASSLKATGAKASAFPVRSYTNGPVTRA